MNDDGDYNDDHEGIRKLLQFERQLSWKRTMQMFVSRYIDQNQLKWGIITFKSLDADMNYCINIGLVYWMVFEYFL